MTALSRPPHPALLAFAANPNHAIALLLVGILLVYAECNRPGTVILGCLGALSCLLGVFGLLHLRPAPFALGVIALSLAAIALGVPFRRWNACTLLGGAALAVGLDRLSPQFGPHVDPRLAAACAAIFTAVTTWLLRIALRARRNKRLPAWNRRIPAPETRPVPAQSGSARVQHPAGAPPSSPRSAIQPAHSVD